MNYNDMDIGEASDSYMVDALYNCCAVAEAVIQNTDFGNDAYLAVGDCIAHALWSKYSLLIWNIPVTGYRGKVAELYKDADEVVSSLPATIYIGEYKNKLTKHILRTYVTNLQEEWA